MNAKLKMMLEAIQCLTLTANSQAATILNLDSKISDQIKIGKQNPQHQNANPYTINTTYQQQQVLNKPPPPPANPHPKRNQKQQQEAPNRAGTYAQVANADAETPFQEVTKKQAKLKAQPLYKYYVPPIQSELVITTVESMRPGTMDNKILLSINESLAGQF